MQHPEICKFPSKEFYEKKLKSDHSLSFRKDPEAHLNFWPKGKNKPFVFCDIIGKEGESHTGQKGKIRVGLESKFNREEAVKIVCVGYRNHFYSRASFVPRLPLSLLCVLSCVLHTNLHTHKKGRAWEGELVC